MLSAGREVEWERCWWGLRKLLVGGWGGEMKKGSESALKTKDGRALVTQWRNITAIIIFNTFSFTYYV